MAEIGPDFRSGGYYGEQVETSGGGYDPNTSNDNGPLASLYNSKTYSFTNRFYPRNLASEKRGHYINFYINVAERSKYVTENRYTFTDDLGQGRTATNQRNAAEQLPTGAQTIGSLLTTRKTKRITEAIALYMPENISVQYGAEWQSQSLTDAGGQALKFAQVGTSIAQSFTQGEGFVGTLKSLAMDPGVAEAVGSATEGSLLGNGATDFLLYAGGTALNPQLQVLFKGTQMRNFSFDFLFAPFDETEAKNVLEIIKTFRFHQAPEVNTAGMGRYFVPPSEFDIDFLFNGQINSNIHQIGTCVLQNVNVDYAPNGWSTFGNGMPTHIKMSLQFMETEIVTKQRIDKDNY
jgi:hypothetical protein